MNGVHVFVVCAVLLARNLAAELDDSPRKNNIVSSYLSKFLDKLILEVSQKNLSIAHVELGDEVGRFTEVVGSISGGVTKKMDGVGSWGFKLDMNVTEIAVGGRYDLVHLDVPLLFPFFGEGRFLVTVEAANLSMRLDAVPDFSTGGFDIDIPKFDILVQNSKVRFDNLMNDPFLADFLNELISNLIPDLVKMLIPPLLETLKPSIDEVAKGILFCIKTELITGKVEECIRNLFRKEVPTICDTLTAALVNQINNNLGVSPIS